MTNLEWKSRPGLAWILIVSALLSGCGGGVKDHVVETCSEGITKQMSGESFVKDTSKWLAALKDEGEGIFSIQSQVIVDKGLTSEASRGFLCRVQIDANNPSASPSLILLQIGF